MAKMKYYNGIGWVDLDAANADTLESHAAAYFQAVASKNAANGYAGLDSNGKIVVSLLPDTVVGGMDYQGTLDASGEAYPADPTKGDFYVVSVAGTISGETYAVKDWAVYNGATWDKVDNTDAVVSVAGKTGIVALASADITDAVSAPTASMLMKRDSSGRAQVESPVADKDIANRAFVVAQISGVSQFSDEAAQDAVGSILVDSNSIDLTYDDATPEITADVKVDDTTVQVGASGLEVKAVPAAKVSEDSTHRFTTDAEQTAWNAKIAAGGVTYENLSANGDVGAGAGQVAIGNHSHDMSNYLAKNNTTEFTPDASYEPATKKYVDDNVLSGGITAGGVTYENLSTNGDVGTGAEQVAQGDHGHDLADMGADATHRTVTDAEKTAWNAKIGADAVTYENLDSNGDVGTGSAQVSRGNHSHALSAMSEDSTHRTVTDTEKSTWNGKQDEITVAASAPSSPATGALWIDIS